MYILYYVELTNANSSRMDFSKIGLTYRVQGVDPHHQTPQGQPFTTPAAYPTGELANMIQMVSEATSSVRYTQKRFQAETSLEDD